MFNKKNNIALLLILCLFFLMRFAGAKEASQVKNEPDYYVPVGGDNIKPSDYSKADNWLALPKKENLKKKVDIFFIYPTSWRDGKPAVRSKRRFD